ncbi:MAG TPA: ABC transporter ATP-binding protein [Acetobacteraceae bacterium]|nr:ABC transporter ATP-binding protein [Acetobacteraceae bacterium]
MTLAVERLSKRYPVRQRGVFGAREVAEIRAVDDVSFRLHGGECLGLVGESGCGKTTTARAILHLITPTAGRVLFEGTDIVPVLGGADRDAALKVRRGIQYVFQDPYLSLNPRWSIGQTLLEPFRVHAHAPQPEWEDRVADLLELVGLEATHAGRFPHEFSGGQRQRVGIARALAVEPRILICDEPVSSLDVSIRAQILNLLVSLQDRLGLTYLFISHDLASVRFISDRVAVMYLGRIVELAPVEALFDHPHHHYTHALLQAIPVPDPTAKAAPVLRGELPSAMERPSGCRFRTRCPAATDRCAAEEPALTDMGDGRVVACHYPR